MVRKNGRKRLGKLQTAGVAFALVLAMAVSTGIALASLPASSSGGSPVKAAASSAGPNMADVVPAQVRDGSARLAGKHDDNDTLSVLFMMPFKDQAGLEAFLADVSDPRSANYGHYLTLDEENARFNPDVASEQRITSWLSGAVVTNAELVPNHLYVRVQASTAVLDKLLNIQINNYTLPGNSFYAPDRTPTLPARVSGDISWIAGLSNQDKLHTLSSTRSGGLLQSAPQSSPPYAPQAFATAYNVDPLTGGGYTGAGTNIAITLWTAPPSDSSLNIFSGLTGSPVATRANGRLIIIPTGAAPTDPDDGEAALDVESSSGTATQATVRFYQAHAATYAEMAHALNVAGTDAVFNRFITNSWGASETSSGRSATESVLLANSATGHDYLFSSGDNGSWSGGVDPYPDYPAASAYVTTIGGTRFNGDIIGSYPGEQTWLYAAGSPPEGSGGGFSLYAGRPSWQIAPGFPTGQTHRGYPDIASEGDPATGMQACGDYSGCFQVGGTSLSSPLWAAYLDLTDQYIVAHGRPHLGFPNAVLYNLVNVAQPYPPYHDITSGTNGSYSAAAGWDAVTGLGTPNLYNFARDMVPPPPPTATPPPPPCPGGQFTDVCPGSFYYTAVQHLVTAGVISGYNTVPPCPSSAWIPCFLPSNNVTRGQVAKIITLGANLTINTTGGPHFTDVAMGSTFYNYVETMYNAGIIGGYTTGCTTGNPCFKPSNNVTRGQLSKMATLAFGFNEPVTGQTFQDIAPGSTFYDYVQRLNGRGIISGYPCGGAGEPCVAPTNRPYFRANNNVTRGQVSKIVDLCRP